MRPAVFSDHCALLSVSAETLSDYRLTTYSMKYMPT